MQPCMHILCHSWLQVSKFSSRFNSGPAVCTLTHKQAPTRQQPNFKNRELDPSMLTVMGTTNSSSLVILICKGVDLVLGDHNHGSVIGPRGVGIVVMYKDRVHNRLLLSYEMVVGASRETSIRSCCWLSQLHLPAAKLITVSSRGLCCVVADNDFAWLSHVIVPCMFCLVTNVASLST